MTLPLPTIDIVLITYDRLEEIQKTFTALVTNLKYSGFINVYIADDSSPDDYCEKVINKLSYILNNDYGSMYSHRSLKIHSAKTPHNMGWGANVNHALSKTTSDIVMMIEDDYVLTKEIDLDPLVALLLCHQSIGLVRLDGIAGHRLLAHCHETDISAYLPDFRQGVGNCGLVHYWLLDSGSPDLNLYSNRPALRHRRFTDFYGKYSEGMKLGATEEGYAHHIKDLMRNQSPYAPAIAVPLDANSYFDHIGKSRQHTDLDKEHGII